MHQEEKGSLIAHNKRKNLDQVLVKPCCDSIGEEDSECCPNCGVKLIPQWSGQSCHACPWWFCY
jgi:hypothetical protein